MIKRITIFIETDDNIDGISDKDWNDKFILNMIDTNIKLAGFGELKGYIIEDVRGEN